MRNSQNAPNAPKPSEGKWFSGRVMCIRCHHRWIAVCPEGTKPLECPACRSMDGYPTKESA